jgi:serine/tyrosine/threonine adenylyltransferase
LTINFDNTYRKLPDRFFRPVELAKFSEPRLLAFNQDLAKELNINTAGVTNEDLALVFSGQKIPSGAEPIAQAYAGHQFGHFNPQLGDGRASLLGEVISKNGDGLSALGPVIREYIVSEAMHHLGVPATRALAAVATGDSVYREEEEPGGVFTRVAESHIRIGTFQYFASQGDLEGVKTLLAYAIKRHYPEIVAKEISGEAGQAIQFLQKVIEAQVTLVAQWMSFGFIHGVMNTDNTTVSGETIDFGPCAFMDVFSYDKVFSFIDRNGRYAYINQGPIVQWNLTRLADCLVPLVNTDEKKSIEILGKVLMEIPDRFARQLSKKMGPKFGLETAPETLLKLWLDYLENEKFDFTLSFRNLSHFLEGSQGIDKSFNLTPEFLKFEENWKANLRAQGISTGFAVKKMNSANPVFIPRNHQVQRAIDRVIQGDLSVFKDMIEVSKVPFENQREYERYQLPPSPEEVVTATFCGT